MSGRALPASSFDVLRRRAPARAACTPSLAAAGDSVDTSGRRGAGLAVSARADGGPKVGAIRCVHVQDGVTAAVGSGRVDTGRFRCSASVTVPARGSTSLASALRVMQAIEGGETVEEPIGVVEQTIAVWNRFRGGVELELAVPESLNGCMPYALEVRFGAARKRVKARPVCLD